MTNQHAVAAHHEEQDLDAQLTCAIRDYVKRRNIPLIDLEVNEKGHVFLGDAFRAKHPEAYARLTAE